MPAQCHAGGTLKVGRREFPLPCRPPEPLALYACAVGGADGVAGQEGRGEPGPQLPRLQVTPPPELAREPPENRVPREDIRSKRSLDNHTAR